MPSVVVTVPAGGNREREIMPALLSASSLADHYLLVDSGESARLAIAEARLCPETRDRLSVAQYRTDSFDCATARNIGLESATRSGYDWAMMLDTDERFHANGVDVKRYLRDTDADAVMVRMGCQKYAKVRFFRLPTVGHYRDRVHELVEGIANIVEMPTANVVELPKSDAELAIRNLQIRKTCEKWLTEEPWYGRAWMHLANTYILTRQLELAASLFVKSAELAATPEYAAWTRFKAGGCMFELGRFEDAIAQCALGLQACSYFPELPYLASAASARLGRLYDAIAWANFAISLGETAELQRVLPLRTGPLIPISAWDGPWDVRAGCLEALDLDKLAAEAREIRDRAAAGRVAIYGEKP